MISNDETQSNLMKTVIIKVERTKDGFTAYAENVEGLYAGGNSLLEIKTSILNSIKVVKGKQ